VSSQVWTIVGVVIGAILGGGAQIVNARLKDSRMTSPNLREERRRAYVGMVGTAMQVELTISTPPEKLSSNWRIDIRGPGKRTLRTELAAVQKAQAQVQLVAPNDTAKAAKTLWRRTLAMMTTESVTQDDLEVTDLMTLAQRDLNITP
jgi:hypothetical protein